MAGVVGRAFKIRKNQAKSYGYVKPNGFRKNPGVTTIAAINGRGSYRSARSSMKGLSKNARLGRARAQLSAAEKKAFAARMRQAKMSKNIGRMGRKRKRLSQNASEPRVLTARRPRVASAGRVVRRKSPGVHAANRRKTTPMKRNKRKSPALAANKRRRRRKTSKRRRKSVAAKAPVRRRRKAKRKLRRNAKAKATVKRKRRRKSAKKSPTKRRRRKAKAATKRKTPVRRKRRKAKRKTTKKRRSTKGRRKARKAKARRRGPRTRRYSTRSSAAEPHYDMVANRRRRRKQRRNGKTAKLSSNRRRRHRRNGAKGMFRRNGPVLGALKTGMVLLGGFAVHRVLSNLFDQQVLSRLLPAPAPAAPAPTSGLESLSAHSKSIASVLVAGLGAFAASKVIKDEKTKQLVIGGMVLSALQSVTMTLLNAFVPTAANMLSGAEDGTAARISAMYGLGRGASIMPHYAPITGTGEYFTDPISGVGEYFQNPVSGVGEYLAVQGMQGVGTYERNSNLLEAAAGMGHVQEVQGSHIDPSSDLDRQLTIAEAAAGVGAVSPFEAAAGLQPFEASAGMGAIVSAQSANTWIPGSSNPQLWAGVRPVSQPQSTNEMVSAGVLQTEGGQGIFG